MNLDERAHRAAANLRRAVQETPLLLMERGIPAGDHPPSRLLSFAGTFAAVLLLVGLTLVRIDGLVPSTTIPTLDTRPESTSAPEPEPATSIPVTSPTTTRSGPDSEPTTSVPVTSATTASVPDLDPPAIEITYPANGEKVTEATLRFEGTTEPGARVVSGPFEATVDASGHWSIVLVLNKGGNLASFSAIDAAGNRAEASVSVTYEAPIVPEEQPVPFTAYQTWGSCSLEPPYDEFYGTGKAGTVIEVVSEYGSGWTTVSAGGEWYVKVYFEAAPPGVPFAVKAKDSFGNKRVFEFVSAVGT